MRLLTTSVARIVFALPFIIFGLFHFMNASKMGGMVPVPGGAFWVYLTGAAMIAAGVAIILKRLDGWAGLLLGVLLITYVLSIHLPSIMNPQLPYYLANVELAEEVKKQALEMSMQGSMSSLLKDLALAGAAWLVSGMANNGPGSASAA